MRAEVKVYLLTKYSPRTSKDHRAEGLRGPLETDLANGPILQMGKLRLGEVILKF